MRADTNVAGLPRTAPWMGVRHRRAVRSEARPGPDWFELLVLVTFLSVSVWVLALDLWQVIVHGRVWTGTDGFYLVDQMQYLAWIREAAHHLLASNLFVLRPTPADYFQPAVAISGGLSALGVAPWLSLLLWKPVAVIAAFYGVREYAHRSLEGTWTRRAALALGLFFGSVTIVYGTVGILGDLFPAFLSWGYTFGLLALATMLFALLAYERARGRVVSGSGYRSAWVPALLGALSSSLHPWQGELLILIVIGTELLLWQRGPGAVRNLALPALTIALTGIPLVYYAILGRVDLSWQLARVASKHSFSLATILLALVPLLVPALVAYRGRPRSFLAAATRIWPAAALLIYVLSATNVSATPLHAFEGITIPLSVLAIEGLRRARAGRLPAARVLAVLAVAIATIPAIVIQLRAAEPIVAPSPGNANFITSDEHAALRFLARDRELGGVFSRFYLGTVIPAETGRRTFVGDCLWSQPGCTQHAQIAEMVLNGALPAAVARWFVTQIGAHFVLTDCQTRPDMDEVLAPVTESVHRFGCAAVYALRSTGQPLGPLAESPPHAALRASGRQRRRVQYG
jgi:hypothetical protein